MFGWNLNTIKDKAGSLASKAKGIAKDMLVVDEDQITP